MSKEELTKRLLENTELEEPSVQDVTWETLAPLVVGIKGFNVLKSYTPYLEDIWNGRKLIVHKPFNKMTREEFKQFGKLGEEYTKDYLQHNPANIKGYGMVKFSRHNRGKDKTINYEQYPFLRKNLETAKNENFSTNYNNEADRVYDYFSNTFKGDKFHYLIENIKDRGLRYKMMKNKSRGE